ncbi:hypothetical protein [Nocardia heshunensis]
MAELGRVRRIERGADGMAAQRELGEGVRRVMGSSGALVVRNCCLGG